MSPLEHLSAEAAAAAGPGVSGRPTRFEPARRGRTTLIGALGTVVALGFGSGLDRTASAAEDRPVPLVDVAALEPRFLIDIRYATPDNFFGQKVYPEARCLLLASVARKLLEAQRHLDEHHPGLRLMLKDCYRPHSVQQVLWDAVRGTPKARYVASPRRGSIHAYGAAVDLTLADAGGEELDMGTEYDHLGPLSEPRHETRYLREGALSNAHVRNRRILRRAMRAGGFVGLRNEWWHFDAAPASEIRRSYRRLDVPFSAVPISDPAEPETSRRGSAR